MSSFAIKPETSVKEFEQWLLKISFGVLFVVCGIFGVFSDVLGATIFEDSFEPYDLGQIVGQGNWELLSGTSFGVVVDTEAKEGLLSLMLPYRSEAGDDYQIFKIGATAPIGSIGFWIKPTNVNETNHELTLHVRDVAYHNVIRLEFSGAGTIRYLSNTTEWITLGSYLDYEDIWIKIDFEWDDTKKQRLRALVT